MTQIANFCDLSDFILSRNLCGKNWTKLKFTCNLHYYLKKQYGVWGMVGRVLISIALLTSIKFSFSSSESVCR